MTPRYHPLRVRAVINETPDTKSVVFDVPPELTDTFRYKPGQFLTLRLPIDGKHVPRCYSMSSAPGVDDAPSVTIKRVTGGRGSNWVCDHVKAGDFLEVQAPAGVFIPQTLDGDFLLFGGGSGITPVYAILRSALQRGQGRITLLYANRDEQSVIFRDKLKALAAAHPTRLVVIHWLDSVQGIPSVAQLAELARNFRQAQAFICGPGPFMDAAVAALEAIEMPAARIHVERFASLPDENSTPANEPPPPNAVDEAEVELTLDGQVHRYTCGGNETLLDAALRVGIEVPYSCLAGMCAACMCQITEGSVHLRHNDVLDKKDLDRNMTLTCQAVPTSARVRLKYPE